VRVRKGGVAMKKYRTGRPTGVSNFQRDFTPMVVGYLGDQRVDDRSSLEQRPQ
jgi:hypothetical protein